MDIHNFSFLLCKNHCFLHFLEIKKKKNLFLFKDIRLIREYLHDSYYYDLQKHSLFGFSSSDFKKLDINFDFYNFEKFWVEKLYQSKEDWSEQLILNIIYSSIIKFFYKISFEDSLFAKKVFMEDNNYNSHFFFLDKFKDAKLILMKRRSEDIIASLVERKVEQNDYYTREYGNYNYDYLVKKKLYPYHILKNYEIYELLNNKFPNRVYQCDFSNLIKDNKSEMRNICVFLNINYEEIIETPTHFSLPISQYIKKDFTNEIHTATQILSTKQIKFIKCCERIFKFKNFNILDILLFVKEFFIYFIKRLIKFII